MLETKIQATIVAGVDKKSFNDGVNYATDTGKKIDAALVAKYKLDLVEFQIKLDQARKILKEAKVQGDRDAIIKAQLDVNTLKSQVTEAARIVKNYTTQGDANVSRLQAKFNGLGQSIKSSIGSFIGTAAIITGISAISKSVVRLGANLQQTTIAFTTLLGSEEAAAKLLKDLSTFAKSTPFDLVGIRDTSKQLLAMGVDSGNLIGTLKVLGDVSAGLGVPLERLALAYGQVLAKGRLQGGELKQFTEAGVPIIAELAKNLNVAEGEIQDLVSAGKISALDVTTAFETMTSEGGKFADLMQKQSKSFNGIVSNIGDSITQIGEKIGTALIPELSSVATSVSETVSDYGDSLSTILADAVTTVFDIIKKAGQGFTDIFNTLAGNTNKAKKDQLSFIQVVGGALKLAVVLIKGFVTAVEGAGKIIGTFIGSALNNVSFFITNSVNTAIKAINFLTKAANGIAGTKIKQIDLFGNTAKLGVFNEISKAVKEVGADFAKIDFDLGIEKAIGGVEKLNTAIDKSKIPTTGKEDTSSGGKSAAAKKLEEMGYASEFMRDEMEATGKAIGELADKKLKDLQSKGTTAFNEIEKAIDASTKSIENLQDKLTDVNNELASVQTDIGKRVIEIENDLAGISQDQASQDDFAKQQELLEKKIALEQELALAKANISKEALDAVRTEEAKSETQKLLDKQAALEAEKLQLESDIAFEKQLNQQLTDAKIQFQKDVTASVGIEVQKQTDIVAEAAVKQIASYRAIAAAAREAAQAGGVGGGGNGIEGRATGGPIYAGSPYMVGERGPEMIVPSQNGTVIPNNIMNNNFNVNANVSSEYDVANLANDLAKYLANSRKGIK